MKEYVRDAQPTVTAADAPLEILIVPPEGAEMLPADAGRTIYREPHGDYIIETRCFVTDSMEAAIYAVSGSEQFGITMKQDGGEECRLVWCAPFEYAQMICRGKIVLQEEFCYSL